MLLEHSPGEGLAGYGFAGRPGSRLFSARFDAGGITFS